jgi:hypothetical protein
MGEKHLAELDEPGPGQPAGDPQPAIRRAVWSTPHVILATASQTETKPTSLVDTGGSGS